MTIDISEAKLERNKLGLWAGWALATGAGMLLGFLPAAPLSDLVGLGLAKVLLPLFAGLLIGFLQWLLLRPYLTRSADWIAADGLGWVAGYGLGLFVVRLLSGTPFETLLAYALFGALVGGLQWPVLRREVPSLLLWLVTNILGWTAAFAAGQFILGGLYLSLGLAPELTAALIAGTTGLIAGAITGLALIWIVRQPETGPAAV